MLDDVHFRPDMIILIILDLSLPKLSGFDVLERKPRKNILVVIFSASQRTPTKNECYRREQRNTSTNRWTCWPPKRGCWKNPWLGVASSGFKRAIHGVTRS